MKPVNGGGGKDKQQPDAAEKKVNKKDAAQASKIRRDSDSSEQTQSDGDSGKSSKSSLKLKTKQLPKEKSVAVAPHSTTYGTATNSISSSKPIIRPSKKRDDYQSAAVREKIVGERGLYRRRETNLQVTHPELKNLQSAKFKKELVERSRSTGGYLEVAVKDKNDIDMLASVLIENPSIQSLKLISDFRGYYFVTPRPWIFDLAGASGKVNSSQPDDQSFRKLLSACKNLHSLNLSGCRLTKQNWIDLAEGLSNRLKLQRLSLGGDDFLPDVAAQALAESFQSKTSPLRELCIDGLKLELFGGVHLLQGISDHSKFKKIALLNLDGSTFTTCIETVSAICRTNPELQYLSLGGPMFDSAREFSKSLIQALSSGDSITTDRSMFKAHKSLRFLDLADCGLPRQAISQLVARLQDSRSLIDVRTTENTISEDDRLKLDVMTQRNRKNLEARAVVAFSLLIENASSRIDIWPQELTGVFFENAPLDVLLDIAAVIDDRLDSVATDSDLSGMVSSNSTDSGSSGMESSDSIAERSEQKG
ncbi:MAG: hypothetical protein EBZ75_00025 [Oxalobacteraceae bacterium]|nr:hypothetical protein [Oxalobacteraceae bacterium]